MAFEIRKKKSKKEFRTRILGNLYSIVSDAEAEYQLDELISSLGFTYTRGLTTLRRYMTASADEFDVIANDYASSSPFSIRLIKQGRLKTSVFVKHWLNGNAVGVELLHADATYYAVQFPAPQALEAFEDVVDRVVVAAGSHHVDVYQAGRLFLQLQMLARDIPNPSGVRPTTDLNVTLRHMISQAPTHVAQYTSGVLNGLELPSSLHFGLEDAFVTAFYEEGSAVDDTSHVLEYDDSGNLANAIIATGGVFDARQKSVIALHASESEETMERCEALVAYLADHPDFEQFIRIYASERYGIHL